MAAEALQRAWSTGWYDYVYDVDNNGAGDGGLDIADVQIIASVADCALTAPEWLRGRETPHFWSISAYKTITRTYDASYTYRITHL